VLGRERSQGGDRRAVVTVFGVVVVLDHQPARPRPVEQGAPTLRGEDDASRILVGGRDQDGFQPGRGQRRDVQPGAVHRHRNGLESPALHLVARPP
jgi:hypothetical protein